MNPSPTTTTPGSPRSGTPITLHLLWQILLAFFLATGSPAQAQVAGAVVVYPTTSSLEIGTTQQFTAYVPISPNTITWSVNNVLGGNATYGTITPAGLYTAPAVAPAANVVSVRATSTAYPGSVGTGTLTITRKYPWLWSVSPSPLATGNYQVSFNGANFAPDSKALANGVALTTTYVSPTKIVATGNAAAAGTIIFAVRQPGLGAVTGNTVSVTVKTAVVSVAVSPTSASVALGSTRAFTATVSGSANTGVTWSVNGTVGGSATIGTITPAGVYTAPAVLPSPATVTVRATSAADPTVFAQSTITLTTPPVVVAVTPATASVVLGATQSFATTVTGNANTAVTWSVNGTAGGSATVGTITPAGVYTAPLLMPAPSTITLRATSAAVGTAFGQSTVTLTLPPVTVAISPAGATVQTSGSQTFTATVTGTANTAVTWSVNGTVGGSAAAGFITPAGVFTAPAAKPAAGAVTVRATSVASPSIYAQALVSISLPPPPQVWLSGARFLDQSSFGASPATLARVELLGIPAYLEEQFTLPETPIPVPADNSMGPLRNWALYNYGTANDQLRQRVAYALSQIVVTSANKLVYANESLPYLQILSRNAFGNYRTLLREISTGPSMGKYLDLANSMKPGLAGGANENYPRELMQLFTIGLWQLNQDGSQKKDAANQPIPTYTQATVAQVALALTGWTYATAPGATPRVNNWEYFGAPMETRPQNHDTSAKTFLGCSVPANQTVDQDLDSVLDCLMSHPNIAPFIVTRLIRSLVTSNPSPGYIQRVADVFLDNGAGVRGDLQSVVRAILLDPEARDDSAPVDQGRLREPILQISALLRALNGGFTAGHQVTYLFDYMAQPILAPPSVFSWFSPLYHIPKSPLFGPEFQIYSPTEAALRGNFFFEVINYPASDMVVDLSPFQPYGNDMPGLVEAANQILLHGRMPDAMKTVLINAATPGYDAKTRIETVLYLTALSGQFAVQY